MGGSLGQLLFLSCPRVWGVAGFNEWGWGRGRALVAGFVLGFANWRHQQPGDRRIALRNGAGSHCSHSPEGSASPAADLSCSVYVYIYIYVNTHNIAEFSIPQYNILNFTTLLYHLILHDIILYYLILHYVMYIYIDIYYMYSVCHIMFVIFYYVLFYSILFFSFLIVHDII